MMSNQNNANLEKARDGQVTTFPSHKSRQVFMTCTKSSQVKSDESKKVSLTSQVKSPSQS